MAEQLEIAELPMQPRIQFGRALIMRLVLRAERATGIDPGLIVKPCRERTVAYARFAVMKAAAEGGLHKSRIGRLLGMDHSSVCHGIKRAEWLEDHDEDFRTLVMLLRIEALQQ